MSGLGQAEEIPFGVEAVTKLIFGEGKIKKLRKHFLVNYCNLRVKDAIKFLYFKRCPKIKANRSIFQACSFVHDYLT